jgi:hypothetical protein
LSRRIKILIDWVLRREVWPEYIKGWAQRRNNKFSGESKLSPLQYIMISQFYLLLIKYILTLPYALLHTSVEYCTRSTPLYGVRKNSSTPRLTKSLLLV